MAARALIDGAARALVGELTAAWGAIDGIHVYHLHACRRDGGLVVGVELVDLLAQGAAYKEIADQLSLSVETIRMKLKHIYAKLHVHSRGEAVAKYLLK